MDTLFSELRWLPRPPSDFKERLRTLRDASGPIGREAQFLARHALDLNELAKLAKALNKARADGWSLDPLSPFRLAVLSNSNIDLIIPALVGSAARHGVALEIIQSAYDQVAQEALTPNSTVNSAKPDAVLLALDFRALPLRFSPGNADDAAAIVQSALAYLRALRDGIKANTSAICIFQNFAASIETQFGSLDASLAGTQRSLIDQTNHALALLVANSEDLLLDTVGLAATVGIAAWHNPRLWNLAKLPFSEEFIPLYAEHVARLVAALRGKTGKVLILDLDDTVWGASLAMMFWKGLT